MFFARDQTFFFPLFFLFGAFSAAVTSQSCQQLQQRILPKTKSGIFSIIRNAKDNLLI